MRLNTSIISPNDPHELLFAGTDIRFTKNGGFAGEANIFLLEDVAIKFGKNVSLTFFVQNPKDQSPTYAIFDCDGFKELHVSGKLTFDKDLIPLAGCIPGGLLLSIARCHFI